MTTRSRVLALALLTGALAVAFLVVLGIRVFASSTPGHDDAAVEQSARAAAAAKVAKTATSAFLDVDYRDLRSRIDSVLAHSTGTFHDQYSANASRLEAAARQGRIVSVGNIKQVGVSEISTRTATVYVAADNTITNTAIEAAKARGATVNDKLYYRVRVDLVRVGSAWLVANLVFVP